MNKKIILSLALILFSFTLFSQVGINIDNPNPNTLLHVSEKKVITAPDANNKIKGVIIPRLTETERDRLTYVNPSATPKVLRLQATDNSLLIFNTTENCYNYWNGAEQEWNSLCGKLGKAELTLNCSSVEVTGSYIQGKELGSSNTLKMIVNVSKPGDYTIVVSTTNGYNFFTSGTLLSTGNHTITISGQGVPNNVQTDNLHLEINGLDTTCAPPISINVLSTAGIYSFNCRTVQVNGVYKTGIPLTASNTVTVPVNVTTLGSYTITTNIIDGISFYGSGTFTTTGNQNITLFGSGTPTSTHDKTLIMTSDSRGTVDKTCSFKVIMTIPIKKMLCIGDSPNGYGYNLGGTAASGTMITTPENFGTLNNSTVKSEGFTRVVIQSPSLADLNTHLLGSNPVDIVVLGYPWVMTDAEADVISQYIIKKGVVLAYSETNTGNARLFKNLFNDPSITSTNVNAAGALYKLPLFDDPILNGPFGDVRDKLWGEDASATSRINNLPINDIVIYSTDADESQNTPVSTGAITAFRHKLFNLVWVGDGGFNSNCGASNTICPFVITSTNYPTFKPIYGRNNANKPVYNAVFTANAIAWAIRQAEFDGINTP